jgi:cysteine desulfurase
MSQPVRPTAPAGWPPPGFCDALAGAGLNPGGQQALTAAFARGWADPARRYRDGRIASMLLEASRETIALAMGMRPAEVSFTASATDAMHRAISGRLAARPGALVVSAVEHSAILRAGDQQERAGARIEVIPVDRTGRVDTEAFISAVRAGDVSLACLQAFNHEVGTAQPVFDIHQACLDAGVPLLVDATTAIGRVLDPPPGDVLIASALGWSGPAGVGVLGIRAPVAWAPAGPVDERESGRVPGTPPVALIAVAARALEWAIDRLRSHDDAQTCRLLLADVQAEILARIPGVSILGSPDLPYLLALSCMYTSADALVDGLDAAGFAVSSGSSCVADTRRPSHVLQAMGVSTQGNVRLTLPIGADATSVTGFVDALAEVIAADRQALDAPDIE